MNTSLPPSIRQAGFSVTELMIAVTLGLILLAGVIQVFTATRAGFNVQQGSARAQESGRTGIYIISRTARHAGYWRVRISNPEKPNPFSDLTLSAVSGTEGGAGPDTLSIRFEGNTDLTLLDCLGANAACYGNADCTSNPVDNAVTVVNTFQLSAVDTATGTRSLQCRRQITNAKPTTSAITDISTEPILEGVSNFQVQYGVAPNAVAPEYKNDVQRYVNADQVSDWKQVRSLRFTLTTNSVQAVGAATSADRRLTQTYTETVALRNR